MANRARSGQHWAWRSSPMRCAVAPPVLNRHSIASSGSPTRQDRPHGRGSVKRDAVRRSWFDESLTVNRSASVRVRQPMCPRCSRTAPWCCAAVPGFVAILRSRASVPRLGSAFRCYALALSRSRISPSSTSCLGGSGGAAGSSSFLRSAAFMTLMAMKIAKAMMRKSITVLTNCP